MKGCRVLLLLVAMFLATSVVDACELQFDIRRFFVRIEEPNWMNVNAPVSLGLHFGGMSVALGWLQSERLASSGLRLTFEYRPRLKDNFYLYGRLGGDRYSRCDEGGVDYSYGLEFKANDHLAVRFGWENGWLIGAIRPQVSIRVGTIR
ncbi:MAG: hypothetical protein QME79_14610 [Bacillota bacterium]|nr:hypothetical protein [Bacillota bacterium]